MSWKSTGRHFAIPCTIDGGLLCVNSDQDTGVECGDFEVRLKCAITYTAADPPAPVYHWDFSTQSTPYGYCSIPGKSFDVYPNNGGIFGHITSGNIDMTQIQGSYPGSSSPCIWPFTSDGTMSVDFGDLAGSCLSNPSCCQNGFTVSVWLMVLSTGADEGFILSTGAHDFEASYGVSLSVAGAVSSLSPTVIVQISIDTGLLETHHTVSRDEWVLLIISLNSGTLTSRNNTDVVTDLVPLIRDSAMVYPERYTRLRLGSISGPAFAIGDLKVFMPMLSNDQMGTLQTSYDATHVPDCRNYHTPDEIYTNDPATYSHHYEWPSIPDGVTYFTFKVRATQDALLSLSPTDSDVAGMYQIVLGGWGNSQSQIRLCKECYGAMTPVSTPSLLNPYEYREFYVSFAGIHIQVGVIGQEPFMSLEHNTPYDVKYVGIVTGYGDGADWTFCGYGGCNIVSSCYAISSSSDIGISPGDFIPNDLTQTTCKDLCAFLGFIYSVVAGSTCYCRYTSLPTQWITDPSMCATPCPGDSGENCGDANYVIQSTSCSTESDFELGEVYQSAEVGQTVAIPIEAEGKSVLIAVDYGDGTPIQSPSAQQIRPHVFTIPGKYVVSASSSTYSNFYGKAVAMTAVSGVGDVVLDCPEELYMWDRELECQLHVFSGSDLELDILLDDNIVMSLPIGCKLGDNSLARRFPSPKAP
ncbi:uncharacterized protein [Amphiura filiformis]|uniref:uncharacterized protein n=1 Tax=Amphiura filiformis TaxID=82378 RepID=UPI003B226EE0